MKNDIVTQKKITYSDFRPAALKTGLVIVVLASVLFVSAGTLSWWAAWLYLGVVTVNTVITILIMDPELVVERTQLKAGFKKWDLWLAAVMARVGPLSSLILIGLDHRFGWSPQLPLSLRLAAFVVLLFGLLFTDWAIVTNRFFAAVVRIQTERGHSVVSTGPYRLVRHPGYLGAMLYELALPLALGALWAYLATAVTVSIIIVRTQLEDRTLQTELPGYDRFTRRTRYRLLPGIW